MTIPEPYPIGTPGKPWGAAEVAIWQSQRQIQRLYADDVLTVVERLREHFEVIEYGRLDHDPARYPLFAIKSRDWQDTLPTVLVTGGVHGYETSGVHGALRFIERHAEPYRGRVNLLVAPCVSPWGYETVQRWNLHAVDPNRSFRVGGTAQEALALMQFLAPFRDQVRVHVDLHETTDTDETEFGPARAARDGKTYEPEGIPDGFYLVEDDARPQLAFQQSLIDAVAKVTHIAPADADGKIIGSPVVSPGLIRYPLKSLGLCAGVTDAPFRTTTEVYPDSPRATPEACIAAQVAAVTAAIEYALARPA